MLNYLSSKNGVISLGKLVRASRVEGCSGIADGTGFASLDPRVQLERLEHAEEDTVRTLLCAALMALVGIGAPAIAQGTIKKSKTKISVDEGKKVAVTGCVTRTPEGEFSLTHAAGKDGALGSYILIAKDDQRKELEKHVGHRVEVQGKAADQGDGKLTVKNESKVRTTEGDTKKRESTTKVEGDLNGLPFLGVKSVRMLAAACP
ncbi:MAG: hypothetical protein DMF84_12970 [Acidobacteria bacterium]|nr:MAG: hypothetical protein DMF84_12970 [Acidobacteriota bacterium]